MQDILGLGDNEKLKAAAGLAGGIGHRGSACGIVTAGTLALGLANPEGAVDPAERAAMSCARTREFLRQFNAESKGTLCRDISGTDFDDDRHVRKYYLTKSQRCIKLASLSAALLVDTVDTTQPPEIERLAKLNSLFSESGFNCAHTTFMGAADRLGIGPALSLPTLVPLNGGIAYSGATCGALLGGCLIIGLEKCGDLRQNSILRSLRRILLTIVQGAAAFNRIDLSPANDALIRCAELSKWFEGEYGPSLCREITGIDFDDEAQAREYFDRDIVSKCASIAKETGAKAAQLAR
jgi:hypothetical protein